MTRERCRKLQLKIAVDRSAAGGEMGEITGALSILSFVYCRTLVCLYVYLYLCVWSSVSVFVSLIQHIFSQITSANSGDWTCMRAGQGGWRMERAVLFLASCFLFPMAAPPDRCWAL